MKNYRPIILFSSLVLFVLVSVGIGVSIGSVNIPLGHTLGILGNKISLPIQPYWPAWEEIILFQVRLPRIIVAVLAGSGLAMCGAVLQALFRNPLADPGVLGVSSGASLGAVIALFLHLSARSVWFLPLFAIIGAGLTALGVYTLATRRGQMSSHSILLAGIAFGSLNVAFTSLIISLSLANYEIGRKMIFWLMGGLDGRTWDHVFIAAPFIFVGTGIVFAHLKDLDALTLGDAHASSVGVDVAKLRRNLIAATSLVTGAVVAVSGTVGFVGLVIPHMVRLILGPRHIFLIPASLLTGAVFIILADVISRTLIAPEEIRLGVITAIIGTPFFLLLLIRQRRENISS